MTDRLPTFSFRRIHLPSGREYQGTFNASHDACFADPNGYPPRHIQQKIVDLIGKWNRQQPTTWRYFL